MNNEEKILAILEAVQSDIAGMKVTQGQQGEQLTQMNEKLEDLDKRVENIEERVEEIDKRIENIEERVEEIDKRVENIEERVEEIDKRVENIEGRVEEIDKRVENIEERVEEIDKRVENIEGRVEEIDKRVENIEERVEEIDERTHISAVMMENQVLSQLRLLYEGHGAIMDRLDAMPTAERMEALESDLSVVKDVVKHLRQDVNDLKKAQ